MADSRTEHELKLGVTKTKDFNLNTAFCDYAFGWGFYGMGNLRHCNNANGPPYGKSFKKIGVLGCFLNMNKGTISYALDGEYFGVAFEDSNLKQGPIYPAISLLHIAGCIVVTGKQIPDYFLQEL